MANYHTHGTQHAFGVSVTAPPPPPRSFGEPTAPAAPVLQRPLSPWRPPVMLTAAEMAEIFHDSDPEQRRREAKAYNDSLAAKRKRGPNMVWAPLIEEVPMAFEENKALRFKYR